jgi:hypothetical protein
MGELALALGYQFRTEAGGPTPTIPPRGIRGRGERLQAENSQGAADFLLSSMDAPNPSHTAEFPGYLYIVSLLQYFLRLRKCSKRPGDPVGPYVGSAMSDGSATSDGSDAPVMHCPRQLQNVFPFQVKSLKIFLVAMKLSNSVLHHM